MEQRIAVRPNKVCEDMEGPSTGSLFDKKEKLQNGSQDKPPCFEIRVTLTLSSPLGTFCQMNSGK